jgi:hypothetical protein
MQQQRQQQIPPLRCGMTNKKTGDGKKQGQPQV